MKPRGKAQWPPQISWKFCLFVPNSWRVHRVSPASETGYIEMGFLPRSLGGPKVFQMPAEPKSLQRPILDTKYCQLSLCLVTVIIKFFMERWCTLRYLLLWVKSLKHTRSVPTTSSCSDNYIPCLMVDNYTVTGIAKRKQWLRLFTARTHEFFLSLPEQALPWPAWCPW